MSGPVPCVRGCGEGDTAEEVALREERDRLLVRVEELEAELESSTVRGRELIEEAELEQVAAEREVERLHAAMAEIESWRRTDVAARAWARAELLARLRGLVAERDVEAAHGDADEALLEYINDPEIREAFEAVPKWYA